MKRIIRNPDCNNVDDPRMNTDPDLRNIKICTWNLRTLDRAGAVQELENVLNKYRANITAIQEMRWIGHGIHKRRTCDIYFSCHERYKTLGCGFVVGTRLRHMVIDWTPVNERLCTIRIKAKFFNISLICAHAPIEDAEEAVKDAFYSQLEGAYQRCPQRDIKIILGDFNAKIGKDSTYGGTIGCHSLHETSTDNGTRLIDMAVEKNLVISSTRFPHPKIHKATWLSPNGRTANQIDHVMISARHASNILDVRSFRGANIDSDHYLVMAKYRARLSNSTCNRRSRTVRRNIEALKSDVIAAEYSAKLSRELQELPSTIISAETHWSRCVDIINRTADSVLGHTVPAERNSWFDAECARAIEKKMRPV